MTAQRVMLNDGWACFRRVNGDAAAETATADLISILDTVDVPLVVVGRDFLIDFFNKAAAEVLGLSTSDIGRPSRDISVLAGSPRLEERCSQVIASGVDCRADFRQGDKSFVVRISPFTNSYRHVTGTVLTFTNVTAFRASMDQAIYERECTKAILNTVADPLVVLSADQRIQSGNRAFYTMFGVSRNETQGAPFYDLGNGALELPPLRTQLKGMLAGSDVFQPVEVDNVVTTRGQRTLILDACPLSFPGHSERRVLMTFRDITARKQAEAAKDLRSEEELRRSEAFLAEGQRLSLTGSFSWKVATDEITWSEQLYRIFGFEPDTPLTIERINRRVHPEDLPMMNECIEQARASGADFEYSHRLLMRDGSVKYLTAIAHASLGDEGCLEYVGAVQDVTQRRLSEEAQVRRSALRAEVSIAFANEATTGEILAQCAEAIVHHLDAAFARIWTLNKEENVLELQASAGLYTHLNGPHSRVPVGELKIGLIVQEKKPCLINDILDDPRINDKEWAKRNGMVAFAGYPLIIEDRAVGVLAMFSRNRLTLEGTDTLGLVADLTALCIERKRTEETLNATKAELVQVSRVTTMGELAASVAHEVRQPLAAVANSATAGLNWLNSKPPNLQKARNSFKRIIQEDDRASDILTRIREMLQKAPMTKTPLSINDVVSDVVAVAREQLRRHQVSLKTELAPDLPNVLGDRIQLQQVLLNLVINAIEAMAAVRKGRRQLLIRSCSDLLEERRAVLVLVRDSGLGLSEKNVEQIFKAFFTTKSQGMGMGLSISRSIIEAHGGRLSAQKNDGPGATFQFALPSA